MKDNHSLKGFCDPTTLPASNSQHQEWQNANYNWWEKHPMRYDWKNKIMHQEFSKDFFLEIDKRFFSVVGHFMPWDKVPFDSLIDFSSLKNKDVLEIGVGNGSHAQLLAEYSRSFTGIDITDYAVKSTLERMKCFNLKNYKIIKMDAEKMEFDSNSFDFIWSWGVIHHTANTANVLKEMQRVLRPHGQAITMVYHRNIWNYYIMAGFLRGVICGGFLKTKSLHQLVQQLTDGAIARYYKIGEWRSFVSNFFDIKNISVYGAKPELFPLPSCLVKDYVMALFPDRLTRFFTNKCKFGSFLVSSLEHKR